MNEPFPTGGKGSKVLWDGISRRSRRRRLRSRRRELLSSRSATPVRRIAR